MMEYDAFNSRLIGTGSYLGNREPTLIPELTPQERQDLIVPPSDHLPAERVRTPVNEQPREEEPLPRAQMVSERAASSKESVARVQEHPLDAFGRRLREVDHPAMTSPVAAKRPSVRIDRRAAPIATRVAIGVWEFMFGSLQNATGTIIALVVVIALAVYFGIRLVAPQ